MFKDAPKYFSVFRGAPRGRFWEPLGDPQGAQKRSFSQPVAAVLLFFKKARIWRCFEAHVISEFSENSKVLFLRTVATVLLLFWVRGLVECSDFSEFGGPRGLFSQTVVTVLMFPRVLKTMGNQR